MTQPGPDPVALAAAIPEDALRGYVLERRWFGAKSREVSALAVSAATPVRAIPPLCVVALVETTFDTGTHDVYQLPLGFRPADEGWTEAVVAEVEGWTAYDAAADPVLARELVHLMRLGETLTTDDGRLEFRRVEGEGLDFEIADVAVARPMGAEQSNTSIVFDDEHVLKLYRRLEAGINPELELLRFLTERGFPFVAALEGWAAFVGRPMDATLAILQQYVATGGDGWELALEAVGGPPEGAEELIERLGRLGEITAQMHSLLASEPEDPNFCPEEPSVESFALLTASIDEEIAQLFLTLPDDEPSLDPIRGRGEEVRERLRLMSRVGAAGKLIRHHGDYHLGQVLWTGTDWILLDFEGEPARSLPERRRKRSPLRDVAGMLRSFAYAASVTEIERGASVPEGWEGRARDAFLNGYLGEIDQTIVPAGEGLTRLLSVFELEKAVYELRYELDNRPDWVPIPVAGIQRLLEEVEV
ncbi:MAG TPA: phosphotransferase [Gaiellaceae bacterium]